MEDSKDKNAPAQQIGAPTPLQGGTAAPAKPDAPASPTTAQAKPGAPAAPSAPPEPQQSGFADQISNIIGLNQMADLKEANQHLLAARSAQEKMGEGAPKPQETPWQNQWGSVAMAVAALGGMLTKTPVAASLDAMADVLNSFREKDYAATEQHWKTWKTANDAASKMLDLEMHSYENAMKRAQGEPRAALANLQATAAAFHNTALAEAAANGDWPAILNHGRGQGAASAAAVKASQTATDREHLAEEFLKDREGQIPESAREYVRLTFRITGKPPVEFQSIKPSAASQKLQGEQDIANDEFVKKYGRLPDLNNLSDKAELARLAAEARRLGLGQSGSKSDQYNKIYNELKEQARISGQHPTELELQAGANRAIDESKNGKPTYLTNDAVDMLAESYIITGNLPNLGRSKSATDTKTQIINAANKKMLEQGLNPNDFAVARMQYAADKTAYSKLETLSSLTHAAEETLLANMKIVEDLAGGMGSSFGPFLNKTIQAMKTGTGDPETAALATALGTIVGEYAKIMSGGAASIAGTPEGARKEASEWMDRMQSPAALAAQFDVIRKDSRNRTQSYDNEKNNLMKNVQSLGKGQGTSGAPSNSASENVPRISTTSEFNDLPPGAVFIDSRDGKQYRK